MAVNINVPSQVKTYTDLAAFPASGALKTIYIAEDTNKTYRWTGSVYVEVSAAGASGITIGTTAITSGTVGRVLFEGTGNVVQESANLFWDNTNGRLGIGTASPSQSLTIASGSIAMTESFPIRWGTSNLLYGSPIGLDIASSAFAVRFRFTVGGNFLINTTTDAGFRLDVNGTARVNSTTTTGLTITQVASGDAVVIQNGGYIQMASTRFRAFSSQFQFQDISYNTKVNLSMSGFSYFNSGGNYTFGSTTEVLTALLNLDSTTKGFLPPRMTTTQRNAIASPAAGLVVYDNTDNKHYGYNGTTWNAFY